MKRPATAKTRTGFAVSLSMILALLTAAASAQEFPFERELLLDAAPMRGSKRVPGLEVSASGQATIDLWCKSGHGQVIVAGDTITIIPGAMRPAQCGPEQTRGDDEILANLMQVTHWRREADVLILLGPTPLRFRSTTN
jgi:heat shock protein HslJ